MKALVLNAYDGKTEVKEFNQENSLRFLQSNVEGYIALAPTRLLEEGIDVWVNDEGMLLNLPVLIETEYQPLFGNVVFTRHDDEGNTIGLTDEDIKKVHRFIQIGLELRFEEILLSSLMRDML